MPQSCPAVAQISNLSVAVEIVAGRGDFSCPPRTSRSVWSASSLLALSERRGAAESGSKLHALQTLREIGLRLGRAVLYRRIPFGKPSDLPETQEHSKVCGLEIRDTASWKPALQAFSPGKTEALRQNETVAKPCHRRD